MRPKKSSYVVINEMSCYRFLERFPDETAARKYIEQLRWRGEPYCPHCGCVGNIAKVKNEKPQPYRCRDCRKHFSVRTKTVFAQSNLPLHKFLYAIYLMTSHRKGMSSVQFARELGITQKSAWHLAHRIRKAFDREGGLFAGPVEVDETYIGGKEKNRHKNKRKDQGRGVAGKSVVVGVHSRRGGKVQAIHVANTDKESLQGFIKNTTKDGETVYTDDHRSYQGMVDFEHESVRHSVGEYVRDQVHINGIESFWALLKRGYYGIYHQMSEKHLHRYINEFSGRHNMRKQPTMARIEEVVDGMFGVSLPYKELTK